MVYRGYKYHSETIVTKSKAVSGNDLRHSETTFVAMSQSPIELTLDNEPRALQISVIFLINK